MRLGREEGKMERGSIEAGSVAERLCLWGSTIVGFLGIIIAINATLSGEYVGAGVCLAAAALAFVGIGLTRRT